MFGNILAQVPVSCPVISFSPTRPSLTPRWALGDRHQVDAVAVRTPGTLVGPVTYLVSAWQLGE